MLRTLKSIVPGWLTANGRRKSPAILSDPTIAELSRKLWGGFSQQAREDLHEIVTAGCLPAQKTLAAWELSKFNGFEERWQQCLHHLNLIRELDESFLWKESGGPLYLEALLECGLSRDAEACAGNLIDGSADQRCASSNIIAARESGDHHHARLALLNRLYSDANLAEVALSDFSRGFIFGNLTTLGSSPDVQSPEKISVLMTACNAEPILSVAVSGVLNQTWRNLELILVDDGSSDGTWELIEQFAREDPRIVGLRNARNMGVYQARNKALAVANGDFITGLECDTWAHPEMLHAQVQAMLEDPEIKVSFPNTTSVSPGMKYDLSVNKENARYVYRSSKSYLIRSQDFQHLGKWDAVISDGDEEFVQRARLFWGREALQEILPGVPMLLCLGRSSASRSPISGARHEYAKQAEFWRRQVLARANDVGQGAPVERVSTKSPFPIPNEVAPRKWSRDRHYDVIIISDLSLLGGTRRCNEGYIAAAINLGMKVGLFHWPRYDLRLVDDIASEYRTLSYRENVDILTVEDRVSADLVLIHHPPIMKYVPDDVPKISTERLAILVNQLPKRFGVEDEAYYRQADVEAHCSRLFGLSPVWIPISPLVRSVLSDSGFAPLAKEDWIPPLGTIVVAHDRTRSLKRRNRGRPVVGRHSRDHRTKWPENEQDLRAAYCANSEFPVRFLGGATFARATLSRWPENWEELAFDSMLVSDFLKDLDFFVHFTHSAYVEEFGRNVLEAIASGIPAIVPPSFREVFGDAACYAEPDGVEDLIHSLWNNPSAYLRHVEKGLSFVTEYACNERVERRLQEATCGFI